MKKKKCTICKLDKELKFFNKNKTKKDGLNNLCCECSKNRSKKYYSENVEHHKKVIIKRKESLLIENRNKVFDYLIKHPCIDCDEANPIVLDFDHKDENEKDFNISKMVGNGYSWSTIKKEITKCDIRCANCHRKRTAIQFNWYKGTKFDTLL